MPQTCKKLIGLYRDNECEESSMVLECVMRSGHGGPHEWHVWSDDDNEDGGRGKVKVIR